MKLSKKITGCIVLMLISTTFLFSQSKSSRQTSMDAFSKGDYEQAYTGFSRLLETYPKDPLYKYYSGACLVELKREIPKAETLLRESLGSGSLKSLPAESLFYLARAQQYLGNYRDAERAYNRFTEEAGRKRAKELEVPEFVRQCREGTGKLQVNTATAAVSQVPPTQPEPVSGSAKDTLPKQKQPLPADVDKSMGEMLNKQYRADSIAAAATVPVKKPEAQEKVVTAVNTERPVAVDTVKPKQIADIVAQQPATSNQQPASQPPAVQQPPVSKPADQQPAKPLQKETASVDTTLKIKAISSTGTILSVFEVLPKPVNDPAEKIMINPAPVQGLVYRIQVAVFRNPVSLPFFKGLSPVYGFKPSGSSVTTYYIGLFRKLADAAKALSSVRSKGFKDAFVVSQMDGKTVSSERAAMLEKEWGNRSLFNFGQAEQEQALDTIPPALVFRVQVARTPKPLKDEVVEDLRRIAGSRPFDIQPMDDNTIAYLIGNFITFESAGEYASLLVRNGYRESIVVAWLGKKQIDVDTARKLFESLK